MTGGLYPVVDQLLDGKLAARLRDWRKEGLSLVQVAERLRNEHNVSVSYETIRRWLQALDVPPPEPESTEAAS